MLSCFELPNFKRSAYRSGKNFFCIFTVKHKLSSAFYAFDMPLWAIPRTYLEQAAPSFISASRSILESRYENINLDGCSQHEKHCSVSLPYTFFTGLSWNIMLVIIYLLQELMMTFLSFVLILKESDSPTQCKLPFHYSLAQAMFPSDPFPHAHIYFMVL